MIHANNARVIAETINEEKKKPKYIWKVLNDRIEYAVSRGDFHLEFSESFDLRFEEHRKEVKRKLEELGYKVEYRRFMVGNRDYQMWLNKYFISW